MFLNELKKRNVPSLKSRAEMLELLQREEAGGIRLLAEGAGIVRLGSGARRCG